MGMVKQVPLTEAKAHLSSLVNDVAYAGARVLILSHGRPKAELVPVRAERGPARRGGGRNDPVEAAAALGDRLARARRTRPWVPSWKLLRELRRQAP